MTYKLVAFILLLLFIGCKEKYTPRPHGYFRIDFPEKSYRTFSKDFPYSFDIADYALIQKDKRNPDKPYWINVVVPENDAELHLSYYDLDSQNKPKKTLLAEFIEESRELAYKHSIKADAIEEQIFMNPGRDVYGTVYRIKGNAASPIQFFLTDSTQHFLRGALYINATPNIDSLKPVINFLEPDILRLIETTRWN